MCGRISEYESYTYVLYVRRNFAYEKFGVVVVVVSSLTSGAPCQ